jgi:hypothetical protein
MTQRREGSKVWEVWKASGSREWLTPWCLSGDLNLPLVACYPLIRSTGLAMFDAAPAPLRFDDRSGSAGSSCIHSLCLMRSLFLSGGRGYQEYNIGVTVDKVTGSASSLCMPCISTRATSASLGSEEFFERPQGQTAHIWRSRQETPERR